MKTSNPTRNLNAKVGPLAISALLAVPTPGASNVPMGIFLVFLSLPGIIRLSSAKLTKMLSTLSKFALPALISGYLLGFISLQQDPGRAIDGHKYLFGTGLVISLVLGTFGILYAIEQIGTKRVVIAYSICRIFLVLLSWNSSAIAHLVGVDRLHENPWKYGLSDFVILIILVSLNNVGLTRISLVACIFISVFLDSRTTLAICFILLLKTFWRRKVDNPPREYKHKIILFLTSMVLAFTILPTMFNIVAGSGILGNQVKVKTLSQERVTSNALLAGRPEQLAALALFKKYPFGFGIGVVPSSTDYFVAISNLPVVSGLQANSTVASYFKIDGRYSFHSYLWDFWALYGLFGLGLIIFYIYNSFSELMNFRCHSLLLTFVTLNAIWDLLFSPPLMHQTLILFALAISNYGKVESASDH